MQISHVRASNALVHGISLLCTTTEHRGKRACRRYNIGNKVGQGQSQGQGRQERGSAWFTIKTATILRQRRSTYEEKKNQPTFSDENFLVVLSFNTIMNEIKVIFMNELMN